MDFLNQFNFEEAVDALQHLLSFIPYSDEILLAFVALALVRWGLVPLIGSFKK
jgi:hypothetical protein